MQRNTRTRGAVVLTAAVLLLAGCQTWGWRTAQQNPPEDHDRPLSNRQVANVQLTLARSLERKGDLTAALAAYQQAIDKDPRQAVGYWRMAILQDRRGKVEESEALYREALKRDSQNPDLLCDFGYSLYLQRRWAESEQLLRQAIEIQPKHARAHNHLGMILAQMEQPEAALAEFRKAGCNKSEAHSNLALVLTLNQHWDDARRHYQLALDANPDSEIALAGLDNLETVVAKTSLAKSSPAAGSVRLTSLESTAEETPVEFR